MGEGLTKEQALEFADGLQASIARGEANEANLRMLFNKDPKDRYVGVLVHGEGIDLSHMFVDLENSDPRFTDKVFTSADLDRQGIKGRLTQFIERDVNGRIVPQIELNVGTEEDPILCYLNYNAAIKGCYISEEIYLVTPQETE